MGWCHSGDVLNFGLFFSSSFGNFLGKELGIVLRFELLGLNEKVTQVMFEHLEFPDVEHPGDANLETK